MSVRILIVDDHEVVREGIRIIIDRAKRDWKICGEATNGQEAIEATGQLKPDIILLDITMPVMSGLDAASRIAGLALTGQILIFTIAVLPSLFRNSRVYAGHNLACGDISGEVLTGQDPFQRAERLLHFGARGHGSDADRLTLIQVPENVVSGHSHIFSLLANMCVSPFGHNLEYGILIRSR